MNTTQENTENESLQPGLTSTVKYKIQLREPLDEDTGGPGPWLDHNSSMYSENFNTFDCAVDVGAAVCVTGHSYVLDFRILRVITTQYVEVAESDKH